MTVLRNTLLALACLQTLSVQAETLPSLGDASSAIVAPEQEYRLGRAWLNALRGHVNTLNDPVLVDFIEKITYKLVETSQLEDRRLTFILLDSSQLNAFAAPGGVIGVNGGLFLHAQTEGEFASVMAHELAHLSQRHFARGLEEQRRMQLPMMAALMAGVVAAAAGAGDAGMAAIASTQAAAIQSQRSFSRQNEQEADRIGITNLQKAGYNPNTMPTMFERLMRQYRYSKLPPEFLMTHPLSDSRIADTQNRAASFDGHGINDTLIYQLMRARIQIQYETTAGLAVKQFRTLLADNVNNEAARYGLALAQLKAEQYEEARNNLKILLNKSPHELIYQTAHIDIDLAENKLNDAEKNINTLLIKYPENYIVRTQYIQLLIKQKRYKDAEKQLDNLLSERPDDSDLWYLQAETRGQTGNIIGVHRARAEYFARVGDYKQALEQLDFARRRASGNYPLAARIDARYHALRDEQQSIEELLK